LRETALLKKPRKVRGTKALGDQCLATTQASRSQKVISGWRTGAASLLGGGISESMTLKKTRLQGETSGCTSWKRIAGKIKKNSKKDFSASWGHSDHQMERKSKRKIGGCQKRDTDRKHDVETNAEEEKEGGHTAPRGEKVCSSQRSESHCGPKKGWGAPQAREEKGMKSGQPKRKKEAIAEDIRFKHQTVRDG